MKILKSVLSFIFLVLIARLWIEFDQNIFPKPFLMPVFIIIMTGLMVVYYVFNRPLRILRFALLLSISTLVVAVALSLVQHVIIAHNFSLYWKHSLIMWMISFFAPFLVGLFYAKISKKN